MNLDLAIGLSAKSRIWRNKKYTWNQLKEKLSEKTRTPETFKEFSSADKKEKLKIKDVGGYVGGYLKNGRRKPEYVIHRQILTLDIDFAHLDFWDDFCVQFSNAAVIHGTHSHSSGSPRYRLIMPLSRKCTPDEYVAVARRVAGDLGIDLFDNTTFETNRLMFWPSYSKDGEYYYEEQEGDWLDVDEILGTYEDWTDTSLWPTADKKLNEIKNLAKKQEDPEIKKGIIGAFCRAFPIHDAIDYFLSDIYESAGDDRFTYKKGSASGGLVIYDDKFAYSHHGTDPCSGLLCNSFDLVRIHKFGDLDTAQNKNRSMKAMEDLAKGNRIVKKTIATENIEESKYDFAEEYTGDQDMSWAEDLEVNGKGDYVSSAPNLNIIFGNDPKLQGVFKQNDFDGKKYIWKSPPWRKIKDPEPIKNVDLSGIRNYIETIYGIVGNLKIEDSLNLEFQKHSFHPIRSYLDSLEWDGAPRVDKFLIDYFGAEDTLYTREAIRKTLVGAVARIYVPGIKFDLVLTLVGDQGTGKSTFVNKMGKSWSSDTFLTVNGKDAFEQLQGAWLVEMAELAGLRKAEVESIKHFISKQEDTFRPAYGRTSETYKRQCVFIGTTNNKDFLRDPSGNRRFMPVDINIRKAKYNIFTLEEEIIDQIWAESVSMFRKGEPLYLSIDAEVLAKSEQNRHSESDERRGLIEEYLDTLIPENWDKMDIYQRRAFLHDPLESKTPGTQERDFVCVAEIWCECLEKEKENMDRYKTREVNDILRSLDGWEQSRSTKNFPLYGKQKYYARRLD